MDTFTVTATELKNNTAEILNRVFYEKKSAQIERHGDVIATLVPKEHDGTLLEKRKKAWKKLYGAIPDMLDAKTIRKSFRFRIGKRI